MPDKTLAELAKEIRENPDSKALNQNALDTLMERYGRDTPLGDVLQVAVDKLLPDVGYRPDVEEVDTAIFNILDAMHDIDDTIPSPTEEESRRWAAQYMQNFQPSGGRRSRISRKFDKCVKKVRRTVKARKGSSKESAAIAICATSVLHPRGRTIKRYRKGRLTTQKKR